MYRIVNNIAEGYYKLKFYTEEYFNENRDLPEFQNAEEFRNLRDGLQDFVRDRNYNRYILNIDDTKFIIEFV